MKLAVLLAVCGLVTPLADENEPEINLQSTGEVVRTLAQAASSSVKGRVDDILRGALVSNEDKVRKLDRTARGKFEAKFPFCSNCEFLYRISISEAETLVVGTFSDQGKFTLVAEGGLKPKAIRKVFDDIFSVRQKKLREQQGRHFQTLILSDLAEKTKMVGYAYIAQMSSDDGAWGAVWFGSKASADREGLGVR